MPSKWVKWFKRRHECDRRQTDDRQRAAKGGIVCAARNRKTDAEACCRRRTFETISDYCDQFSGMIPVGFVLGFFVTTVVDRWWDEFNTIPWPANVALLVSANLQVGYSCWKHLIFKKNHCKLPSADTGCHFFEGQNEANRLLMYMREATSVYIVKFYRVYRHKSSLSVYLSVTLMCHGIINWVRPT